MFPRSGLCKLITFQYSSRFPASFKRFALSNHFRFSQDLMRSVCHIQKDAKIEKDPTWIPKDWASRTLPNLWLIEITKINLSPGELWPLLLLSEESVRLSGPLHLDRTRHRLDFTRCVDAGRRWGTRSYDAARFIFCYFDTIRFDTIQFDTI